MDIFIKWNGDKNEIKIPVLPSSFSLNGSVNNTSVIIQDLGEINLKGKRNLYSFGFNSFFPCQAYDFAHDTYKDPYEFYIKSLKTLFEGNTTVHVIVTETSINGFFTIESFSHGHSEKVKDVDYSLTFKEYREIEGSGRVGKEKKKTSIKWKKVILGRN